jgi:ZIP family zinc transporter
VGRAFFWGALAASSLVFGALVALSIPIRQRLLGSIMAFGSGVLVAAVAYELVLEAMEAAARTGAVASGMFAGAFDYYYGDALIDRSGGDERNAAGKQANDSALGIVLGTILDGIPESVVLGLTVLQGAGNIAMLAAVLISNVPEAIASTIALAARGWRRSRILVLWFEVLIACGLAALSGYAFLEDAPPFLIAFILSFAAGAIVTMLGQTMIHDAATSPGRAQDSPLLSVRRRLRAHPEVIGGDVHR